MSVHNIALLECIIQSQKMENKRTVIITIWKIGLSLVKKKIVLKIAKLTTVTFLLVLCVVYCVSCMYQFKKNALNFKCVIKGVANKKYTKILKVYI